MSSGSSRWTLDLSLIRRGSARIVSPLNRASEDLSWHVKALPTKLLPISVVECSLTGLGRTVRGYGDGLTYTESLTQAFAESWERIWFDALAGSDGAGPEFRSSNGFAAGPTPDDARASARAELIERAVFLQAWDTRKGWERIEVEGLLPRVLDAALTAVGWQISLFRLTERRLGEVICGLGLRRQGGVLFDSSYRHPGRALGDTQAKVLRSLLRSALVLEQSPAAFAPLPQSGDPSSHREFYVAAENLPAFDFLSEPHLDTDTLEVGGYDDIDSKVVVDIDGFPCVASARNPQWPQLCWGRESIRAGGNQWPHPLA